MRKGTKTLIKEIKGHRERMAVFNTTFHPCIDGLSKENQEKICEHYRKRFENWWGSWIGPKLDEIEAKFAEKKRTP